MHQKRQPTAEELNKSTFHHAEKGCRIVWFGYYRKSKVYVMSKIDAVLGTEVQRATLSRGKCQTHNAIVCHCGHEVGTHYGRVDKGYRPLSFV